MNDSPKHKTTSDLGLTTGIIAYTLSRPMFEEGQLYQDRFLIKEHCGNGSAFQVYRVEDNRSDLTEIALKVMHGLVPSEKAWSLFQTENLRARTINHHRVVKLVESGKPQHNEFWFLYELMEGGSLRTPKCAVPTDFRGRMAAMADLCDGLTAIHGAGLIHRDLKPSNILVDKNGELKIGDLGIAARPGDPGLRGAGTLLFTDPEGIKGENPLLAHDIYAMAGVAYWWVTGRFPNNCQGECHANFDDVPARLASVLRKAMSPRIEDRHSTARELGDDFRALAERRPLPSRRTRAHARAGLFAARHPIAVGSGLLAASLALGGSGFGLHAYVDSERTRVEMETKEAFRAHSAAMIRMFEGSGAAWGQSDNYGGALRLVAQHQQLANAIESQQAIEFTDDLEISILNRAFSEANSGGLQHTMIGVNLSFALMQNGDYGKADEIIQQLKLPGGDPVNDIVDVMRLVSEGKASDIKRRIDEGFVGVDRDAVLQLLHGRLYELAEQSSDDAMMEFARAGLIKSNSR